ncbi:putative cation-transporting ATPase 13A5 [Tupaia chinensis]|uniref:Cation-transporting ATPase n=1 Tax=Tupaia chinensis TaxID=246437 RepID=L8YA99_TUPCH|nr:putative cation-transporting ATPase 13A5 [Tupaia chinensis]
MEENSKGHRALLNPGEENELEVFGYHTQNLRRALCLIASTLTCGALPLVFYWRPQWRVWANCIPCPLQEADTVLLRTTLRCIHVQKIRYVWNTVEKQFQKVGLLEDSNSCYDIHHTFGLGLTSEEQEVRRLVCGPNAIEVEIQPIWKLLVKQVLNPFYVFQAFTLTLWLSQGYIEYSVAIIILSLISIVLSVYDLRQQSVKLHNLVEEHNKVQVTTIVKDKGLQEMESRLLVPGDILILPGKMSLPCDAVLIDGSCVVNEGMLTGYNTAKGDLVRSILYPRPLNFKLYSDAFKFMVFLACLGVVGFFYALGVYMYHGVPPRDTVSMSLLLLTVTVPPVLPAALTIGIVYAQKRLKKKQIFCISPQRINMCGQINLVCFDKTGTLTEDGLDLWGTVPTADNRFQEVHSFASGKALPWSPLCAAMASCHSLILLNGTIQGDPLDLKMFEGTAWSPVEAITVLRQFPFSSSLQRMSVMAHLTGEDHVHVYMKGAPEMVAQFCRTETGDNLQTAITVAKNSEMIPQSSQVIIVEANEPEEFAPASVTWQLVENQEPRREKNEICINIGNSSALDGGRGTNYHFAMSGKSYQVIFQHFNSLLPKILVNGTIFARMSPGQKSSLIEEFQKLKEGRAALVSSFGVFKYLTMYGIIQFIGTSLLYWQLQLFGNYQYLMQDVAITLMVCLTMSSTQAYPKLAPYRPAGQLLSPPLLLSVFLNSCFTCTVQICAFLSVKQQPWYCEVHRYTDCYLVNQSHFSTNVSLERTWNGNATLVPGSVLSFETTTLWPITTINCITAAFIFSKGKPFRKPIYTNHMFSFLLLSALGLTIFITFSDFQDIYRGMEDAVLQNRELWLLIKKEFGFYSKSQYRNWQKKLAEDPTWPPTNRIDYSGDSKNGAYINGGYESLEQIPKEKLEVERQTTEQHFWTRL